MLKGEKKWMSKYLLDRTKSTASQNFINKWIELGLSNNHLFKFYLTYFDPIYFGGYLSKSSYKDFHCTSPFLREYLCEHKIQNTQQLIPTYQCIDNWILLDFERPQCLNFFLTYTNENFIGGYLIRNTIKTLNFTIIHYQNFLEEYDRRFHPILLPQNNEIALKEREKRLLIVRRAEQILIARLKRRLVDAKNEKITGNNEIPTLDKNDIQYLSDRQLELYKEFFLNEKGILDYKKIQVCFELFNNGEIQGNKYPGNLQPDTATEFLFAEFALLAIDNDIDAKIWAELLKTFVKTQEIFIQVYHPNKILPSKLEDYQYTNFKYYKQINEVKKEMLRKKYDNMSTKELVMAYNENLIRAFPGF